MEQQIRFIVRKFVHKPIYSLITFTGFALGIAASLLIYLWVFNELSYEKFHPDYQRIYRVLTLSKQGDKIVKSAGCYRPVAKTLKTDYPQIENATYISFDSEDSPLQKESGGEKIEARSCWTDDDFFKIFQGFKFIEGSPKEAFAKPSNVVLSDKVARKLFGNQPALGKTLISDKYSKEVYTVSSVVQIPQQSHIDFGFIIPEKNSRIAGYVNSWSDKSFVHVYIKLKENAQTDSQFLAQITNHISRYSRLTDKLMFQQIADIHLYTDYETYIYDKNISSYKYIWMFSGLALLIILMASLNFSVLSVARASERATEIGIKKVIGVRRFKIARQFIGESVFQTFAATILALFLIWNIMPWFNNLAGQQISFHLSFRLLGNLFLLTFMVGIVAGLYPSLYLSSLNPSGIFRGKNPTGSKTGFIKFLTTIQFGIAIFFLISTVLLIKQMNYIRTKDLGLNDKNVVVVPTGLWYGNKTFKDELLKNPNILSVSASVYAPVDFSWQINLSFSHEGRADSLQSSLFWADEDFAKTYNLKVKKGQFLQMDYSNYWKEMEKAGKNKKEWKDYAVSLPIVINETAEKMLGFNDPIGQRLGDYMIVGVVKDFHFRPLHYPIGPLILTNNPENIMTMNIRITPVNRAEILKYIGDTYRKYRNLRGFSYSFFDDLLDEKYQSETRLRNLTFAFAVLAIVIAMLGILGMSLFACQRRTKEIGIRKVNGAKVAEVMAMLNKDFIKWVAIAFVIACPIAWYAMHKWLQNFAYKTELSWWVFAGAGAVAVTVAALTVSWQSWRAATRNPVESLRYE